MSKRARNMDNEQVSAKSEPTRGFCPLTRNDGPDAMKENGRNEDWLGNTAWGNPMPSTDSPIQKIKKPEFVKFILETQRT